MLPFSDINFLAIIVSTIVTMILGMLWYGPIFGKTWMKLSGMKEKDMKHPGSAIVMGLINTFVMVLALALLLEITQPVSMREALVQGGLVAIGFAATNEASDSIWGGSPWPLTLLNAAYALIGTLIASAILFSWV